MESKNILEHIIFDLGKEKSKNIKALKKRKGKLNREVTEAITLAQSRLPAAEKNVKILPVVIIYRKKKKKKGEFCMPMPFPFRF